MSNVLILLIAIGLSLAGCSNNRGDPLAPGRGGGPGASRANLAVTEENIYQASQLIFEQIYDSYFKAMGLAATLSESGASVRIVGNYNGNAIVSEINRNTTGNNPLEIPGFAISYNSYSETGLLYLGGTVEVDGRWQAVGNKTVPTSMTLNGQTEFSGDFSGSISFAGFRLALESNGDLVDMLARMQLPPTYSLPIFGTVVIISGPDTLQFIPYLFDYGPGF